MALKSTDTTQILDEELTSNVNYLQPTGFKILIDRTRYPNLEFFAQSVSHPSVNATPVELPGKRITTLPLAGDKLTFGSLDLTIIADENLSAYQEMFKWLQRLVNDGQVSHSERAGKIPTYADVTVAVLSSHNNTTVKLKYFDCIPTDLGAIELTPTGDANVVTFPITFRFSRFEIIT